MKKVGSSRVRYVLLLVLLSSSCFFLLRASGLAVSSPFQGGVLAPANLMNIKSEKKKAVVRSGRRLTVRYRKGNMVIETLGTCLDSGAVGDLVRVRNIDSRKVIRGVVVSESVVVVKFD